MQTLQRRLTIDGVLCGGILAVLVLLSNAVGLFRPLESWLYDVRAANCQWFTPAPSDQIVYLNVDDAALDSTGIGRWPWRRSDLAALLDEIRIAAPKAVALDVLLPDTQEDTIRQRFDGGYETISEDDVLATALEKMPNSVIGVSFSFLAPGVQETPLHAAILDELAHDVTQTPETLARSLAARHFSEAVISSELKANLADERAEAIHLRIAALFGTGDPSFDEVRNTLLSKSISAGVARQTVSQFEGAIEAQYVRMRAEKDLLRFSLKGPDGLAAPPPDVSVKLAPLPKFLRVISSCGFTDYDIFTDPVVRAVPLLVRHDQQLYPQLALALTCRMLGADLNALKLSNHRLTIPTTQGAIDIPLASRDSDTARRAVGSLMTIPWFGSSDWKTMYDFPAHQNILRQFSLTVAWSIVSESRKLQRNNLRMDAALVTTLLLNDERRAEYLARKISLDDYDVRRKIAQQTLDDLVADGWDQLTSGKADSELSEQERQVRDRMTSVRHAISENDEAVRNIATGRAELASYIRGKGVLIGFTATGTLDVVTTPLHARCPGVVVHGVIANAILSRYFLKVTPAWVIGLLTLLLGLATTYVATRLPTGRGLALILAALLLLIAIDGFAYSYWRLIIDLSGPLIAIAVCWAGCTVVRLVLEGLERVRLSREAAVIDHEIQLARRIQEALIPKELTILTSIDSHGWTLAATTTGGDCFDLWKLADGRLGILVADASGHGLGPSLIVLQVRALVRALCDLYSDPQKLLERVNQRLASDLDGSKFATAFLGFLGEDGKLVWGSAGHGPMLWCTTETGEPLELEATGLPLGVSSDWFGEESVPPLQLTPGGWLAVISDGIFEAPNPAGEQFEMARVKEALAGCCGKKCETVVSALRAAVQKWQVVEEPHDDQTIVIVRRSATVGDGDVNCKPAGTTSATQTQEALS